MRAFAVPSFGEPASIHDLPVPAADDAVLLRVQFAGVNPLDNILARLTAASTYPFVVGIDFAGVVERVPAAEHGLQAGDRVFGMARAHGSYAEYTAVEPGAKMEPLAVPPTASPMTRPPRYPSRRLLRSGRLTCSRFLQASTSW